MPRLPRICLGGYPHHVIQRGHNRSACFAEQIDRFRYLHELRELSKEHDVAIHAYVLMTNHVHLLATPTADGSLSRMMQRLGQRYVQYVNKKYLRTGSLWEGRFRSNLVETESYLLVCHRHIECNPVRATMVTHPGDYRWSSYRCNALGEADPLLTIHPVVADLDPDETARRAAYQALFDEELSTTELVRVRDSVNGGFALGREAFRNGLEATLSRPVSRRRFRTPIGL